MILCQLIIRIMNSRSRIDFKEISERLQTLKALLFHTSNPWQVRQARRLWQAARIGASLYVWRVYFVFKCMQKLDDGRCKESRKRVWILLLISCLHGKKTDFLLQEVFARLILGCIWKLPMWPAARNFCAEQDIFSQEYWTYFKEKWCSAAWKDPLSGCVGSFQMHPI